MSANAPDKSGGITYFWLKAGLSVVSILIVPVLAIPVALTYWLYINANVRRRRKTGAQVEVVQCGMHDRPGTVNGDILGNEWRYACAQFELIFNFRQDVVRLISHDDDVSVLTKGFLDIKAGRIDVSFRASEFQLHAIEESKMIMFLIQVLEPQLFPNVKWNGDTLVKSGYAHMRPVSQARFEFNMHFLDADPLLIKDVNQYKDALAERILQLRAGRADAALNEMEAVLAQQLTAHHHAE